MFAARALRLTCKRFAPLAGKRLYSHLRLLPTADSARKARAVLDDAKLRSLVTTISIQASLEDVDEEVKPHWDVPKWRDDDPDFADDAEHGIEINGVLAPEFKALVGDLGLFRNLRRVELKHHFDTKTEEMDPSGHEREDIEYREAFLKHVIYALNHPEHPAIKLDSLSICNLQDLAYHDVVQSDDFKTVMSRLRSLELGIGTEVAEHCPESEISTPERHKFFGNHLLDHWLKPARHNLVRLKLYSNCYWGYLPKCDLRGLRFPQLKSLALGNMTFTHDWQLDWIISHGATLESLTLDDCPIVHDALIGKQIDSERYCILDDDEGIQWDGDQVAWSYSSRWHNYFRALKTGLPHLRHFGVGHGAWNNGWGEDCLTEAFGAAASLPAELVRSRYVIFESGTGPSPWIEPNERDRHEEGRDEPVAFEEVYDCCWDENDIAPQPSYPDCFDEDQDALDELVAMVEGRKVVEVGAL